MVKDTVNKVGRHLEILAGKKIPVSSSLDMLCRRAETVEEMVVIEVMREVINELQGQEIHRKAS